MKTVLLSLTTSTTHQQFLSQPIKLILELIFICSLTCQRQETGTLLPKHQQLVACLKKNENWKHLFLASKNRFFFSKIMNMITFSPLYVPEEKNLQSNN